MNRPIVLHVGPSSADGGISAAMRALVEGPLATSFDMRIADTFRFRKLLGRLAGSVVGLIGASLLVSRSRGAIVHVYLASNGSFVRKAPLILEASALGSPVFVHIHGGGFSDFAHRSRFSRAVVRAVLARADMIGVLGGLWVDDLRDILPKGRTVVMRNGVPPVEAGATKAASCVVFPGGLERAKGAAEVLEAARRLRERSLRIRFTIVGPDSGDEQLHRWLHELQGTVEYIGWVTEARLHEVMSRCSTFCLPSYWEGLPMSLLQAMSHGLACIVTPVGAMEEAIESGGCGVVVPLGDAHALEQAIARLDEDETLRQALGGCARMRARHTYSLERASQRLAVVYGELMAGW